jgi:hypothetical protein
MLAAVPNRMSIARVFCTAHFNNITEVVEKHTGKGSVLLEIKNKIIKTQ